MIDDPKDYAAILAELELATNPKEGPLIVDIEPFAQAPQAYHDPAPVMKNQRKRTGRPPKPRPKLGRIEYL